MNIELDITFTDSFYLKTNPNTYKEALKDSLTYVGETAMNEMKNEAPVRTGRLREGHYVTVNDLSVSIGNNVEYAPYVIYGTRYQSANNYPMRVMNRLNMSEQIHSRFSESLITQGVK